VSRAEEGAEKQEYWLYNGELLDLGDIASTSFSSTQSTTDRLEPKGT